jgi:hypothetical protein
MILSEIGTFLQVSDILVIFSKTLFRVEYKNSKGMLASDNAPNLFARQVTNCPCRPSNEK